MLVEVSLRQPYTVGAWVHVMISVWLMSCPVPFLVLLLMIVILSSILGMKPIHIIFFLLIGKVTIMLC